MAESKSFAGKEDRIADTKLKDATGKDWEQWFSILDRWGAKDRKHAEIASFLVEEREVPGWWAQTITVGYERARGLRLKHQKADGFEISASKTIAVPVDVLFKMFVDPERLKGWLKDGKMRLRNSRPNRGARFDWEDGSTRVVVGFTDKGPSTSAVSLAHQKLPGPDEAETAKAAWKKRLGALQTHLEP
jgi:hypothetical protein